MIDNLDLINISTHKIKYDFIESEEEVLSICKCCTKCGVETNEKAIKQLFAMDLTMLLELENGKLKEYPKGKWRSNVNARICAACLNSLQDIILSDEFKTLQTKTIAVLPGKRENSISTNVLTLTNIESPEKRSFNVLSNIPFYPIQLNQYYNTAMDETPYTNSNKIVSYSNIELADETERLPSINQIYSNNRYNTNLQQQSRTFEIQDCNLSNMNWDFNSCVSTIPGANNESTAADESIESNYFVQAPTINLLYDSNRKNFDPSYL
uniref:Uncharacterized protein n=1 Tax=Panagrolaimus davidi TaxID=227884 RepID=A0A914Q530_9BILA